MHVSIVILVLILLIPVVRLLIWTKDWATSVELALPSERSYLETSKEQNLLYVEIDY